MRFWKGLGSGLIGSGSGSTGVFGNCGLGCGNDGAGITGVGSGATIGGNTGGGTGAVLAVADDFEVVVAVAVGVLAQRDWAEVHCYSEQQVLALFHLLQSSFLFGS